MERLHAVRTSRLGGYRTTHDFRHFAAFHSSEEFLSLVKEAQAEGLRVYILGRGSNTFFAASTVRTAVLKNALPESIEVIREDADSVTVRTSSSVSLMKVLRYCEVRGLHSFYFLASVPGNVGGAVAMNAGGPMGAATIWDFVDNITICADGGIESIKKSELQIKHRHTAFTGLHDKCIVSVEFTFRKEMRILNSITSRIEWCKTHQDLTGPSLGSVFVDGNGYVFAVLKRLGIGAAGSHWSRKWPNWIVCTRGSLGGIWFCITAARVLHMLSGMRPRLEIVAVR